MHIRSRHLFAAALAVLLLAALLAGALAFDRAPRVQRRDDVSPADVGRAVALARLHDPRNAQPGQLRRVPLAERDVDLLLDQAARRWLDVATRVRLQPGRLSVEASLPVPLGRWLNVAVGLRQAPSGLPQVDSLRVGRLPLPAALALPLLRAAAAQRGLDADTLLAAGPVERVTIEQGRMLVSYRLRPDTINRLRSALVTPGEQERLHAYAARLGALTHAASGAELPLEHLLPPLFALAAERSAAAGADAAAENRAALLTLAFFANRRPLGQLLPAARGWPQPRPLAVTLQQRQDFTLHFLVSAVIAAQSGTPLADAVGLWKELADARHGGSGFSFNDWAADRAGTRFGERAVSDATALQARAAAVVSAAELMPPTADLPEFLSEAELARRYGGADGPGARRLLADIEARVDALAVLR